MRGGVSTIRLKIGKDGESSPHARGCFQVALATYDGGGVFPACAGVFPVSRFQTMVRERLPRMRGGVSWS